MPSRDTRTGRVLENMILPSLRKGRYSVEEQVEIGQRPSGRKHKVDIVASRRTEIIPISLKWQQTFGTAEQKVPFEVICLADAVHKSSGKYKKAYLVLGGEGWTLKSFYIEKGLEKYLRNCEVVEIVALERFVAKANQGEL